MCYQGKKKKKKKKKRYSIGVELKGSFKVLKHHQHYLFLKWG